MISALIHWDAENGALGTLEVPPQRSMEDLARPLAAVINLTRRRRAPNARYQVFDDVTMRVLMRGRIKR